MNEELENVLNSDTPKNQNGQTVEMESESSVVGVIFAVLAWLNLIVGVFHALADIRYFERLEITCYLIGSSLFLFAVASCLKFLAKISSRMGRIMRAVEK